MLRSVVLILLYAIATTVGVLVPTRTSPHQTYPFNPSVSLLPPLSRALQLFGLTNAERLSAGLPPKRPRRISHKKSTKTHPSGTPNIKEGCIKVLEDDTFVGYVNKDWNMFGEATFINDISSCLKVKIDIHECGIARTDIEILNAPWVELYPCFGAITGYTSNSAALVLQSFNYAYLGGTVSIPSGCPASHGGNTFTRRTRISEKVESAIWKCTSAGANFSLIPQWVNPDYSTVVAYLGHTQNTFLLTADKDAFSSRFGSTRWMNFVFIPN